MVSIVVGFTDQTTTWVSLLVVVYFIHIVKTCFPALDSSKTWENAYKMGIARHSNNAIENAGICLELNLTQNLKSANGKQNEQQQQQQQQY